MLFRRIDILNLSPREELINNIKDVFESEFSDILFSDFDVSRIIYDNHKFIKDDFLHSRKIKANSRPDLLVLMKIIYHVQNLEKYDLVNLKKIEDLTPLTLNKVKKDIRKIILNFIFRNPYNIKYIKQDNRTKFQRDTDFWKPSLNYF